MQSKQGRAIVVSVAIAAGPLAVCGVAALMLLRTTGHDADGRMARQVAEATAAGLRARGDGLASLASTVARMPFAVSVQGGSVTDAGIFRRWLIPVAEMLHASDVVLVDDAGGVTFSALGLFATGDVLTAGASKRLAQLVRAQRPDAVGAAMGPLPRGDASDGAAADAFFWVHGISSTDGASVGSVVVIASFPDLERVVGSADDGKGKPGAQIQIFSERSTRPPPEVALALAGDRGAAPVATGEQTAMRGYMPIQLGNGSRAALLVDLPGQRAGAAGSLQFGILFVLALAVAVGGALLNAGSRKGTSMKGGTMGLLASAAERIASGDVHGDPLPRSQTDEASNRLADAHNRILDYLADKSSTVDRIARGDLTINVGTAGDADRLGASLNAMVRNFSELIARVQEGAEQVSAASEEISSGSQGAAQGAQQIAQAAERQASTVEQTSASIEEMTVSIRMVSERAQAQSDTMVEVMRIVDDMAAALLGMAHNTRSVTELAERATAEARKGGDSIGRTVQNMEKIGQSSAKIGEIIGVITDISEQINLLALNAAIEAARAGEHGRGFSVVAEGVTKLAERSQEAAKEITRVIQDTSAIIAAGTAVSETAGVAMDSIVGSVENVSELISSLTQSTEEQAAQSEQIKSRFSSLSGMTSEISQATERLHQGASDLVQGASVLLDISQQNASIAEQASTQAEETSSASEELSAQAQSLQQAAAVFRL